MPAQKIDFIKSSCDSAYCEQGATFYYELIWQKEEPVGSDNYVAVDISNYRARMQVRKESTKPLLIELTTENGRIEIGSEMGVIILYISAEDTDGFKAGLYKYDLELINEGGFVIRLIEGFFEVVGEITA